MKQSPARVAFVTTHPIQYQVPVFRELSSFPEIDLTVLFCFMPDQEQQGDGFGVSFKWDLPLLEGYQYEVLNNRAKQPGVSSFWGCDTPELFQKLNRKNFDAVIVNGWVVKSCLQTLAAAKFNGIPCIVRGEANTIRPRARWKKWIHRRLVRSYSAYLYIGEKSADFYRSHGVAEDRLFPARYCIENDRFEKSSSEASRDTFRKRWSIPDDACVYLFSGKFIEKKHPFELLKAFDQSLRKGSRAHLVYVGDGELKAKCVEYSQSKGLPVTFTGFLNQSEIIEAYAASDCLVLPSDHGETWGLVVNEAMACGKPAIVSDQVGCATDLIEAGKTGDMFEFGKWDQLSTLLAHYSQPDVDLSAMGENARKRVAQYSPNAAAMGARDAVLACVNKTVKQSETPVMAADTI